MNDRHFCLNHTVQTSAWRKWSSDRTAWLSSTVNRHSCVLSPKILCGFPTVHALCVGWALRHISLCASMTSVRRHEANSTCSSSQSDVTAVQNDLRVRLRQLLQPSNNIGRSFRSCQAPCAAQLPAELLHCGHFTLTARQRTTIARHQTHR